MKGRNVVSIKQGSSECSCVSSLFLSQYFGYSFTSILPQAHFFQHKELQTFFFAGLNLTFLFSNP